MPRKLVYLLLALSLIGYLITGFYLQRENFTLLIFLYSSLFIIYFFLLQHKNQISLRTGILAGLAFRFCLLLSFPALSDDVFRFLWDGRLQELGINPFDFTPRQIIGQNTDKFLNELYPNLNSPDYYSVYPQLLQYLFYIATKLGGQNLLAGAIILKAIIILFECGSIWLLIQLLKLKHLDKRNVLIYLLNPLVIIELTGNIHFEALMIFFVLLTAWLLLKKQSSAAAGALSLAVQAKLLPLIAIPLLFKKFGLWRTFLFGFLCVLLVGICSPLLWDEPERLIHIFSSLQLYYGKFEFNGSVYSILRGGGWWLLGYNPIWWVSKIMMLLTIVVSIIIYRRSQDFLKGFFWLLISYLLLSAIVHPWYLAILIALSPFLPYRFALVWSALVPLTYHTYVVEPYEQNYVLIAVEYAAVAGYLVYELRRHFEAVWSVKMTESFKQV